jgi:Tfp pilus assembly protein PilF
MGGLRSHRLSRAISHRSTGDSAHPTRHSRLRSAQRGRDNGCNCRLHCRGKPRFDLLRGVERFGQDLRSRLRATVSDCGGLARQHPETRRTRGRSDSTSADVWLTQALLNRDVDPTDNRPVQRALYRALGLDSTDARVWHFLALTSAENADFPTAMSDWRRSVKMDPKYTQGLAFLGIAHYWQRQFDSARVWVDSAITLDPSYVLGRTQLGSIAVERGDFDRAIASYAAAQRLTNDIEAVNAHAGIALAQARAGRQSQARATISEVESEAGAYSPAPLHPTVFIAQAYAALGDVAHTVGLLGRFQPRESLHFQLHLRCDPPFDGIRADPRFQALMIKPESIVKDCR